MHFLKIKGLRTLRLSHTDVTIKPENRSVTLMIKMQPIHAVHLQ